ncbi:2-oxo acid dehydrogenase subunit E2 [Rhodococcus globerulus]|uniref:Dihydrolipoamide acetyltransferase component of pyruvate dehydrogenase complex n=1 Tax=Rhodococcus globerulus TaxID=33008 RepID=A0ABU4C439_RHOGO|nr:2-oxo acid dehydrogenase subunit E2 [Rhodococcus globerulus]MDV6271059.1 2-oxo acid dehydrogenase subunit E2 [Rhodococcus globerulus]
MSTSDPQSGVTVTLPAFGESITEGVVTRWLKNVGDRVEAGEPLLEVATGKVDTEIPSPADGFLFELLASEDEIVCIGGALAIVCSAAITEAKSSADPTLTPPSATPPTPAAFSKEPPGARTDRVEKLPRIRQAIARRMLESLQTSAQLTTVVEVDVTAIARLRAQQKDDFHRRTGMKLSFLPFFVTAAVDALAEHPIINASVNNDCTEVTYHRSIHLRMAVGSDKGLMVPVIRDADTLRIPHLAQQIAPAADKVRSGTIRPDHLAGGTFTITNTGSRGALFDTPIINQPQSAILGIGTVVDRLVPTRDDSGALEIGVRSMAYLSLSYDHRIVDGADAARYLSTVRRRLETGFEHSDLQGVPNLTQFDRRL